jgi:uncharacterized protein YndB with AHSA1/START domain
MPNGARVHIPSKGKRRYVLIRAIMGGAVWAAVVFASFSAQALDVKSPEKKWTEAYRHDNLVIFTKDVGQDHEILAISELETTPETVFSVLTDVERYAEFMPYVRESRVLSRVNDLDLVTYARIAPPLVSQRDYALHVRITRGSPLNGGVSKLEWTSVPDAQAEIEGVVRVKLNQGAWIIEPMNGGKRTRLTYTVLTDPGGLLPPFVINLTSTVSVPELFEAVRKRAKKVAQK